MEIISIPQVGQDCLDKLGVILEFVKQGGHKEASRIYGVLWVRLVGDAQ